MRSHLLSVKEFRVRVWQVYLGIILLVIIGWIALKPSSTVEMPNLIGLSYPQANELLIERGFTNIGTELKVVDPPLDVVIEQIPNAGEEMNKKDRIQIVISANK
jgi:beta-lactam-binding protein with PASTA domain